MMGGRDNLGFKNDDENQPVKTKLYNSGGWSLE